MILSDQLNSKVAAFWEVLEENTALSKLYLGYLSGCCGDIAIDKASTHVKMKRVAISLGGRTGQLTHKLPFFKFDEIYAVDKSVEMLNFSRSKKPDNLPQNCNIHFCRTLPAGVTSSDLVIAEHVHGQFSNFHQLQQELFGKIAASLAPTGQAILFGHPSSSVADTPDYFLNSLHVNDIPRKVLEKSSSPEILKDNDGYISLSFLPRFKPKDGTQMRVTFHAVKKNKLRVLSLMDTFWSDEALVKAANIAGLDLVHRKNLMEGNHPNAYMAMHFRKSAKAASHALN